MEHIRKTKEERRASVSDREVEAARATLNVCFRIMGVRYLKATRSHGKTVKDDNSTPELKKIFDQVELVVADRKLVDLFDREAIDRAAGRWRGFELAYAHEVDEYNAG